MAVVFPANPCHFYLSSKFDSNVYIWLNVEIILLFLQDYITYLAHRMYHLPFMYKNFHKLHHKYKQPTPFSATAIHPVEALSLQLILALPMICFPVHWSKKFSSSIL